MMGSRSNTLTRLTSCNYSGQRRFELFHRQTPPFLRSSAHAHAPASAGCKGVVSAAKAHCEGKSTVFGAPCRVKMTATSTL